MQNILAIFLPFLIAALNGKFKSGRVRFWIAIVVSIIAGIALNINQVPSFDFSNPTLFFASLATLIVYVGLVVGTAQAMYLKYWQNHPAFTTIFGQPDSVAPKMPIAGTVQQQPVAPATGTVIATPEATTTQEPANDSQNNQV